MSVCRDQTAADDEPNAPRPDLLIAPRKGVETCCGCRGPQGTLWWQTTDIVKRRHVWVINILVGGCKGLKSNTQRAERSLLQSNEPVGVGHVRVLCFELRNDFFRNKTTFHYKLMTQCNYVQLSSCRNVLTTVDIFVFLRVVGLALSFVPFFESSREHQSIVGCNNSNFH